MKLYGVSLSPYFERCILVTILKDQEDAIEISGLPGNALHSPGHMAHNPFGKLPYLDKGDDVMLPEGQMIAEYLDMMLDGPQLIDEDIDTATQQQLVCRLLDMYIIPHLIKTNWATSEEEKAVLMAEVEKNLAAFDHFLEPGKKAVGDSWSVADCALIPFVFTYSLAFKTMTFPTAPKLQAWWDGIKDEAVVGECHARMQDSFKKIIAARKAAEPGSRAVS